MARPYTDEQVEEAIGKVEKCGEKQAANKASAVKLRAAERDLLKAAEVVRDLLLLAVRGDKALLSDIFGGACTKLHRLHNVIEATELSDMHANDQRWGHLKEAIKTVEEVLMNLGRYKPWSPVQKPPESVSYGAATLSGRLTPGDSVDIVAIVVGEASTLCWSVSPPLPAALSLDSRTGRITGQLLPGIEVPERTYVITGQNTGGVARTQMTFLVRCPKPEALEYPGVPAQCFTGDQVNWLPKYQGGVPQTWTCAPLLPAGIAFDPRTGTISGMPRSPEDLTKFTITAANSDGSATTQIEFRVQIAPPISLAYPDATGNLPFGSVVYLSPEVELRKVSGPSMKKVAKWGRIFATSGAFMGTKWGKARQLLAGHIAMAVAMPKLTYSVEPALPEGLDLATRTGVISGMPAAEVPITAYKVSVSNDGGTASVEIRFGIKLMPPTSLLYPESKKLLYTGEPVAIEPEVQGIVSQWSIEPDLPQGLTLDSSMGTICGRPTQVRTEDTYTITASNSEGKATCKVVFAVQRPEPKHLAYRTLALEYPVGRPIEIRPTVEGEVDRYSVAPGLPPGLALDEGTGTISGTATEVTETIAYVVTAENESGACRATLAFCTKVMPPEALSYPQVDDEYGVGETVYLEPQITGGATQWTVEPPLPEGLELDAATGTIRGKPTTVTPEQSHTVVAENEAGGTSVILTFRVASRAPEGLEYPEARGDSLLFTVDKLVNLEATLRQCFGATFAVEPPFPEGMTLDPTTGTISGTPIAVCEPQEYKVTASNFAGITETILKFGTVKETESEMTKERTEAQQTQRAFAAMLERIAELSEMPEDPSMGNGVKSIDWMLWIVHRAHLDDPTLTVVDFTNARMPLPHVEPRIAPKLMKALATNTHITSLLMSNANLRKPQGEMMAQALKTNKTLEILNIETNHLDSDKIQKMAEAIMENPDCKLTTWRFDNQKDMGQFFGRPTEEKLAEMMQKKKHITKLGFRAQDPHWANVINKALLANCDVARRQRKPQADKGEEKKEAAPVEKSLTKILVAVPPEKAAWEIFNDDDENLNVVRAFIQQKGKFPTKDHLTKFAKALNWSISIPFSKVAPLLKNFRADFLNAFLNTQVTMSDDGIDFVGTFAAWTEKNERFTFELITKNGLRYSFATSNQPVVETSREVAAWAAPHMEDENGQEKRYSDDGGLYTYKGFVDYFGQEEGDRRWAQAAKSW